MTPDMMTDNLSRAQDRLKAYEAACRKALPLIEAAERARGSRQGLTSELG